VTFQVSEPTDHAIRRAQALDLDHGALAGPIFIIDTLGDNAVR
jgi:hypothetical protein